MLMAMAPLAKPQMWQPSPLGDRYEHDQDAPAEFRPERPRVVGGVVGALCPGRT